MWHLVYSLLLKTEQQKVVVDYESKDGPLGFAVGDTEKTITIKTFLDDDDNEPNEDFFVALSPVTPEQ